MSFKSKGSLTKWAEFKDVNVYVEQKRILSNINLSLYLGENIVILGPNGSGKTTFLKLINRSIYPIISEKSSFKLFNKENINIWDLRRRIGFLLKEMDERVNRGVTLYELISSGFHGTYNAKHTKSLSKKQKDEVKNLIDELSLSNIKDQEFITLSTGQKRRALLARALVFQPKILVLDEPFCNLDIKSNYILERTLTKLIDNKVNLIYVTHSLESILSKTTRVILIKNGSIVNDGKPSKIIKSNTISDLFDIPIKIIREDYYWRGIANQN